MLGVLGVLGVLGDGWVSWWVEGRGVEGTGWVAGRWCGVVWWGGLGIFVLGWDMVLCASFALRELMGGVFGGVESGTGLWGFGLAVRASRGV